MNSTNLPLSHMCILLPTLFRNLTNLVATEVEK